MAREQVGVGVDADRHWGSPRTLILILSFVAFVSLGFPDAVLGVAWPSLRGAFDLPQSGLGIILAASGCGYLVSGLLAGWLIARTGVGWLLVGSTALVSGGLFGYALSPAFPVFLAFAVGIGFGSGAIDSALNFFATEHFSEAVMSRLHGFFGVGALVGPIIMGGMLDAGATWRWGYAVVASILFGMTVVFVATRRLWDDRSGGTPAAGASPDASPASSPSPPPSAPIAPSAHLTARAVLARPVVWVNMALFFLVAGVEMTSGQWAFTVMRERFGQSEAGASLWAGAFWGAIAVGRLTLGAFSAQIGAARLVQWSSGAAAIGGVLYALGGQPVAVAGLLLVGLAMSTLFPLLMSLTPRRIGRAAAAHAVGFQISAALVGGVVLPWIAGGIAARTSLTTIGWAIVVASAAFFALHGLLMRGDSARMG